MSTKKIAVMGTGANGSSIGADMTRAGHDVTLIDQWPEHVEAMRANGVRIEMPNAVEVTRVKAIHCCEVATLRHKFDHVFFGVKAYDTKWATELMRPVLADNGLAVGIQNGMTVDDMAAIIGPERTLGAVIEIAANIFTPGIVERQTPPSGTWFCVGGIDARTRGREQEMLDLLSHCGKAELSKDIRSSKWMKLVANAAEVLPSAVLGIPLIEAVRLPNMRPLMEEAAREAVQTALALGHQIVPIFGKDRIEANDPEGYAVSLFDAVLEGWSLPTTRVATLQDWLKGRRGEVADINGVIVSERSRLGGDAPINRRLIEVAYRIESGELKPEPANIGLLFSPESDRRGNGSRK